MTKIKKFCREYIAKLMRKLEKSGKLDRRGPSSSKSNGHAQDATPSTLAATPASGDGSHDKMDDDDEMEMTVEEAMDLETADDVDYNEEDTLGDNRDDGYDRGDYSQTKSSPPPTSAPTPSSSVSVIANAYAERRRRNPDYYDNLNNHDPPSRWGPPGKRLPDRLTSESGYDSRSGWSR